MKKTILKSFKGVLIAIVLLQLINIQPQRIQAQSEKFTLEQSVSIEAEYLDFRAQILKAYLEKHNSPLANHSQDFIEAADAYGVDWKLVPAISGVESTFGKRIPGGYNAWGWGVYGDQALGFKSWTDGIYTLNKGLKEDYISRGLTDPYSMNRRYASSQTWGVRVDFFMKQIEQFAQNYRKEALEEILQRKTLATEVKTAGQSAALALSK